MDTFLFDQITRLKRELLPNERMVLFGSQARGDAREDSDWDLLVVLNKDKITHEDWGKYSYPFAELGWKYGKYFSTKVYSQSDWQKSRPSLFYKNVETEGIEIL